MSSGKLVSIDIFRIIRKTTIFIIVVFLIGGCAKSDPEKPEEKSVRTGRSEKVSQPQNKELSLEQANEAITSGNKKPAVRDLEHSFKESVSFAGFNDPGIPDYAQTAAHGLSVGSGNVKFSLDYELSLSKDFKSYRVML